MFCGLSRYSVNDRSSVRLLPTTAVRPHDPIVTARSAPSATIGSFAKRSEMGIRL